MDLGQQALALHRKYHGKIATAPLLQIKDRYDLSLAYTPGVAEVSKVIAGDKTQVWNYTIKSHTVAVVTDGSAVLGLGNIGPEAALPVMEGKALLFKALGDVDAFPICLATQDTKEIIRTVKLLAPNFGGINLEDICAPRCFAVEDGLQDIGIPVMHDDQHGTAVVVLAGLLNAAKVAGKRMENLRVVVSGAGAAGTAIAKILASKVADVLVLDTKGLIYRGRPDLDEYKNRLAKMTNKKKIKGAWREALIGVDVFIGVSKGGILKAEDIKLMAKKPIVFAMANPIPEIMPDEAKRGGAFITASGRSDFPNQINNVLAFPGIFMGALSVRATKITEEMKLAAALALAGMVKRPAVDKIIPNPLNRQVSKIVAKAVAKAWKT
ncbi:malate dehydrogenase [Candidatus Daviesbacteria bacterium RIFCSPLOWO2_01_FULL_43_38]|uniref:Malate dehydrogenase n=2 Tax=Candidatus Daviesiibacteriota TaxID=1752718 RepID=A0A1F5K3N7_9BACT|nr:MAG: malate dehydrogenase [Candidatus Daviesbacteria bacterium RIFCSPHIGHO2_01_FULL_43_17]OGE35526.1 MAG: malate dehydrogenase [Candidatus Daviesbacteria bacterium RIFCSPHIGHO2_12_FULL_43_11]OGE63854.1 MAG: malate dehydrogenase [Candidatus Daviesbacteria bacterium RIFCSPLOWO2_01_FULL_43_38]